ncbi:MAG TPA: hypothetical protein PKE69_07920, partial [Pyrinomonadaceae bacterium]|nr:hypothetical protein [Pyrinomonadaceae bacterium]
MIRAHGRKIFLQAWLNGAHGRFIDTHLRFIDTHGRLIVTQLRLNDLHGRLIRAHLRLSDAHGRLSDAQLRLNDLRERFSLWGRKFCGDCFVFSCRRLILFFSFRVGGRVYSFGAVEMFFCEVGHSDI